VATPPAPSGAMQPAADDAGHVGIGECTPLPAYSPDTLGQAQASLATGEWLPPELDPEAPLQQLLQECSVKLPFALPAARFAAETALVDLLARRRGIPCWQLLRQAAQATARPAAPVALTCLIQADEPAAATEVVHRNTARGIRSFKLKLAGPSLTDPTLRKLDAVREALDDRARLRLDANATFTPSSAPAVLEQLTEYRPEFVEQPTPWPEQLTSAPLPLALDESLQPPRASELLPGWVASAPIEFVVLKPMALGGIGRCLCLAAVARRLGLGVVVSHLFDGPVACAACCALALAIDQPPLAAGLGHHAGLSAWPPVTVPGLSPTHVVPWSDPGLGIDPQPLGLR
jgi:L-alanine-DL-glutamate epimerase-like enolase superfamily enzyme